MLLGEIRPCGRNNTLPESPERLPPKERPSEKHRLPTIGTKTKRNSAHPLAIVFSKSLHREQF
jgi:hypothetical protein